MREQQEIEGLSVVHLNVVGRYVAAGAGPPPAAPLRFWIGGEWVEPALPDPELAAGAHRDAAQLERAEAVDPWSAVRARDLPVYRWVLERVTDDDGGQAIGGLRPLALTTASGRPIGRRPLP